MAILSARRGDRCFPAVRLAATLLLATSCSVPQEADKVSAGALEIAVQQRLEAVELHAAEKKLLQARIAELENENATLRELSAAGRVRPEDAPQAERAATPEGNAIDLVEIGAKPIESNDSWTKFSWRAVVRNNLDQVVNAKLTVSFQDSENYELDTATLRIRLAAGEERTFSGTELLDAQVVHRVARVGGRIER